MYTGVPVWGHVVSGLTQVKTRTRQNFPLLKILDTSGLLTAVLRVLFLSVMETG